MIQIQDDNVIKPAVSSAPVSVSQVSQAVTQPEPAVSSASATISSSVPAPAPASSADNSAEIDRLLAELDKLSKELEEKKAETSLLPPPPVVPMSTTEPATVVAPVAPQVEPVSAPISPVAPQVEPNSSSQESSQDQTAKDSEDGEKFDFDAFLSDLEKKIDEESKKKKDDSGVTTDATAEATTATTADAVVKTAVDTTADADPADFRKNRSTPDLGAEQTVPPVVTEPTEATKVVAIAEPSEVAKPAVPGELSQADKSFAENSEELKAQNIFEMLGLSHISDAEKNQFLDELESMIWDDFVMHDLELLLTSEEYAQARKILDDPDKQDEDKKKEELIVFLEKLIPDLDEVLYEKALELKSEMIGERLSKMKENASEAVVAKVKEAEDLISQNKWRSAATLLNEALAK